MFRSLFERLVNVECVNGDLNVIEVNSITGDNEEMLAKHSIEYDELINFSPIDKNIGSDSKLFMLGCCVFYRVRDEVYTVVFIEKTIVDDSYNDLYKYMILVHEIGHVHDFRKNKYTNWKRKTCDLVKAEAFAEIFSLKYYSKRNDKYHRLCRELAARRILDFTKYGDELHYSILCEIKKTYPHGKLSSWAAEA